MPKNSQKKWVRSAKSFRMALGALIIKEKLGISDRETVEQIKENPYLQYFIGMSDYSNDSPARSINDGNCSITTGGDRETRRRGKKALGLLQRLSICFNIKMTLSHLPIEIPEGERTPLVNWLLNLVFCLLINDGLFRYN